MRLCASFKAVPLLLLLTPGALATHAAATFRPEVLAQLDSAITNAIAENKCPGAVVWIERNGEIYLKAFGQRAVKPDSEPMTLDAVFDVASLTKVVATAPAMARLIERGEVKLDDRVQSFIPEFKGKGAEAITVRHLLTHTSGLLTGISGAEFTNYAGGIARAVQEIPRAAPGAEFTYCDLNFILLAEIIRRVTKHPFEEFVAAEFYRPLRMNDTGFLPSPSLRPRIAPTQELPDGILRGQVHDPTARRMGGVTGSAGIFSTAADLARFARMMLNEGELDGVRVLKPETVRLMTGVQSPVNVTARRGLGWDIDSGYSRPRGLGFPLGSYGHTGFTGVFLWIDPFSKTFVILLTNRLHPDGQGNVNELYGVVSTLAALAVEGFDFKNAPGALPFRTNFISNWGTATNLLERNK
jgi:CubicO group peptidase (beta-lactamase class C family)